MISTQSQTALRNAVQDIIKRFTTTAETAVTDFHFQANCESGNLVIFDDDDNQLSHVHIPEWENIDGDNCYDIVEKDLRSILATLQKEGALDNMNVLKPYSCLLVDEEKETIVDLLYVDDDTLIINDELLKGLDEEMDEFLKHLLED